jgi:hypothetical protein
MNETRGTRYDSVDATSKDFLAEWPGDPGYAAGRRGNAANFVATEQRTLTIPNFVFAASYTLSLWVYGFDGYPGNPANSGALLFCAAAYPNQTQAYIVNGGYYGSFVVGNGSEYQSASGFYNDWVSYASGPHWALIIASYNADNKTPYLYVRDGINNASNTGPALSSGTRDATAATLYLGGLSGSSWSTNRIDEVGYWSRVLTVQERSDLWDSGFGLYY